MKKLALTLAVAAGALAVAAPAQAQRVPAATVIVIDTNKAANECNACRTALAQLRTQSTAFENRRTTLNNQLGPERQGIQTAINALNGKPADAALQARVKAFEAKAQQAEQELARTQENLQSINYNILRQIKEKLDPAVRQVMATKGASVVLEAGSILQFSPALDATNEIVAALNSTLPSISVTPLPQQAKPQSR
jgi:Skp family chaperone for outer membrane proteins